MSGDVVPRNGILSLYLCFQPLSDPAGEKAFAHLIKALHSRVMI